MKQDFRFIETKSNNFVPLNKNCYKGFIQETNKKLYKKYCENKVKLMSLPELKLHSKTQLAMKLVGNV